MTELQEILHKHCPQMDIVDIIIDYKRKIESEIIERVQELNITNRYITRHSKILSEYNEIMPQNNERICVLITQNPYLFRNPTINNV